MAYAVASLQSWGVATVCSPCRKSSSNVPSAQLSSSFRGAKVKLPAAMAPGFLQNVRHGIFNLGSGNGNGRTAGADDPEPRLGHSGEPLYTTLAGHPVSDDNNR